LLVLLHVGVNTIIITYSQI